EPQAALTALLAVVRVSASDPFHRGKGTPPVNEALRTRVFEALDRLSWDKLTHAQKLELLRVYEVALNRMGPPDAELKKRLIARLSPLYPAKAREHNAELCQLLIYLEAPNVVGRTLKLMAEAPTQEEQMEYARWLRLLKTGWTLPQ